MTKRHLVIATRKSPLALCQAEWVRSRLMSHHPGLSVDLLGMTTQADDMLGVTLRQIGGKGLFVKELETALFDGRADMAVHSMKDVPMELPEGLVVPVMCEREEPRDVFVSSDYASLAAMPSHAVLGTSSLRRQTQIQALRQDVQLRDLRGNIHTRLKRLDDGDFSAIILAAAGLKRMGLTQRIRAYLSIEECLPSAGQGALGIECRTDDVATQKLIGELNHLPTFQCVSAERQVCRQLEGGCQTPLAAYAVIHQGVLSLQALIASQKGVRILRARHQGAPWQAEAIGSLVAEQLIQQGAKKWLQAFHAE